VVKHANAARVWIHLSVDETAVHLQIKDDGVGFEQTGDNGRSPGGFGLHTMQERAQALHGRLQINSTTGEGTAVQVSLPLMNGETK
jgi:two-component system sensor histidine kinase UhpB